MQEMEQPINYKKVAIFVMVITLISKITMAWRLLPVCRV